MSWDETPEPLATVMMLVLSAAPLITLVIAAWVVGRGVEQAAATAGFSRVLVANLTTPIFVASLIAARFAEILPTWRGIAANPLDLLRLTGSGQLSALGGILGAGVGFVVFTRQRRLPLLRTADLYGQVLPLGIAVYDGGCLARGDCYGRVAPAPFGIVFSGFELPHYPVGLYAAALALFVYAGVQWFARRQPLPGAVALVALTAIAGSYALLAPLRLETAAGNFDVDQAAAVAIALGALCGTQMMWLINAHRARPLRLTGHRSSLGEDGG